MVTKSLWSSFITPLHPFFLASVLLMICSLSFADQVVITPEGTVSPFFRSSTAICYGIDADSHVNLGTVSVTGIEGYNNQYCTIGGGYINKAIHYSTVGGGYSNEAGGEYSTIGGGGENEAINSRTTIGGGFSNVASGEYSTVAGGHINEASGLGAAVGGGRGNMAGGDFSWAGGAYMQLQNSADHTFVWGHSDSIKHISEPNTFLIFPLGTSGKVGVGTSTPKATMDIRATAPTVRIAGDDGQGSSLQLYETNGFTPYGFEFQYDGSQDKLHLWSRGFVDNEDERMTFQKDGNVGIGTTSPGGRVTIKQDGASWNDGLRIEESGGTDHWDIVDDSDKLWFGRNSSLVMLFDSGGNVGIGITEPTNLLHVNGIARSTQSTWATSSDERVKQGIQPLTGSLEKLQALNPVTFEYIESYRKDNIALSGRKTGFIAQEVAEVDPTMVHKTTENIDGHRIEDFHLLNTDNLIPMLVAAIKEQQKIIEEQDKENQVLKHDILKIKKSLGIL